LHAEKPIEKVMGKHVYVNDILSSGEEEEHY